MQQFRVWAGVSFLICTGVILGYFVRGNQNANEFGGLWIPEQQLQPGFRLEVLENGDIAWPAAQSAAVLPTKPDP